MSLPSFRASFSGFVVLLLVACGGTVFNQKDDNGGGSTSTAGGSSQGGSTTIGGKPSQGGSSATGGTSATAGTGGGQTGCANVQCQAVTACDENHTLSQPPGACCPGCMPNPGQIACPEIACPTSDCPLGYIRADRVGGCCTECVPDALFCNDDSECLVADRPRACCGCPEAVNQREYDADPCWSSETQPRPIPKSCYPEFMCNVVCGQCPAPPHVVCSGHHCMDIGLK